MSESVTAFTGNALYLDTMIFYALLRGLDAIAQSLFTRIQDDKIQAYTSVLTFDELAYRLLLALIREHYPGSPLNHLRNNESQMIAQFYPRIAPQLIKLQYFPNLTLVDFTASDIEAMNQIMLQYHLKPRDAIHLAAMQKCSCFSLVSHDSDFDRVSIVKRYSLA